MASTRILVVYDPTTDSQPAIARAAALAKSARKYSDAEIKIHVYSCIYAKIPKSGAQAAQKAVLISAQKDIVERAVSALADKDVPVEVEIEWNKDWQTAVGEAAERIGASAVFKSSHKRSASLRLLKNSSDRALLRQCPYPVLLVKSAEEPTGEQRVILAAVEYRTEAGVYDELNRRIVALCQSLFVAEQVKVHFVNAYTELSDYPDKGKLVRACGVPNDQTHIKMGEPDDVIVEVARELGADLVVIGNHARDGFAAVINNNTAEKILDRIDCNLLALP